MAASSEMTTTERTARVEHVIARLNDWQIHLQCRRRRHAINHSLHFIAELWNPNTRRQLRVNSWRPLPEATG